MKVNTYRKFTFQEESSTSPFEFHILGGVLDCAKYVFPNLVDLPTSRWINICFKLLALFLFVWNWNHPSSSAPGQKVAGSHNCWPWATKLMAWPPQSFVSLVKVRGQSEVGWSCQTQLRIYLYKSHTGQKDGTWVGSVMTHSLQGLEPWQDQPLALRPRSVLWTRLDKPKWMKQWKPGST